MFDSNNIADEIRKLEKEMELVLKSTEKGAETEIEILKQMLNLLKLSFMCQKQMKEDINWIKIRLNGTIQTHNVLF